MTPAEYQEAPEVRKSADEIVQKLSQARFPPEVLVAVQSIRHETRERQTFILHGIGVRIQAYRMQLSSVWQTIMQSSGFSIDTLQSLPPAHPQMQPYIQQATQWLMTTIMQTKDPRTLPPVVMAFAQQQPQIAGYVLSSVGHALAQIQGGWSAKWQDLLQTLQMSEMRLQGQMKNLLQSDAES